MAFQNDFPSFELPKEEEEEVITSFIYLWKPNLPIYEIYQNLLLFLGEGYSLAPSGALIPDLAKEKKLSLSFVISKLAFIHNGYVTTLLNTEK